MRTDTVATYRRQARLVLIALALAAVMCLAAARPVFADGFSMPNVTVEATVADDGTVLVNEMRTFAFEDDINGVFWTIPLVENEQGTASAVEVLDVSARTGSGSPERYERVAAAYNGESGYYTVEDDDGTCTLKVFSPHEDGETAEFTVSYRLTGAVMAWRDTAELYWQFIGPEWDEASDGVTLTVGFAGAGASGVVASAGTGDANFRAWAHGPYDGEVSLDETAPSVRASVPSVAGGEYAEVRVAFPNAWVPRLTASDEPRLTDILHEEEQWAAEANARREQARAVEGVGSALQVALPAVLFLAVALVRFTRGRNLKPEFQDTYWRDVPSDDHPAVIAAFMEDGTVPDRAFVATLMKLTDERVISIVPETREKKRLLGTKQEEGYRLTLNDPDLAQDPIDRAAIRAYFCGKVHPGAERSIDELEDYVSDHAEKQYKRVEDYKGRVSDALGARGLVVSKGTGLKVAVGILACAFGVLSLGFLIYTDASHLLAFVASAVLLVASVCVALTYRVYSREGVELRARCAALKRWLEDFTRLSEAVPGDIVLWNKLLVMAVALDVSDEVLRELADAVPRELREDGDGYCYPVYWWCYPHGGLGSPAHEMRSAYTESLHALASSSESSGAGFGGGFSAGGGGGVGGGGGGTF